MAVRVGGTYDVLDAYQGRDSVEAKASGTVSYWSHTFFQWGAERIELGDYVRVVRTATQAPKRRVLDPLDDVTYLLPHDEEIIQLVGIEWNPADAESMGYSDIVLVGIPCAAVNLDLHPELCAPVWLRTLRRLTGQAVLVGAEPVVGGRSSVGSSADPSGGALTIRVPAATGLRGKFYGLWPGTYNPARLPVLPKGSALFADVAGASGASGKDAFLDGKLTERTDLDPLIDIDRFWPLVVRGRTKML
ncbi:hypothetical protein HK405_012014 [Cladochytrium tenue]|nr:hypothetical protein HK405_012014 [Cladochytrium tenue]